MYAKGAIEHPISDIFRRFRIEVIVHFKFKICSFEHMKIDGILAHKTIIFEICPKWLKIGNC